MKHSFVFRAAILACVVLPALSFADTVFSDGTFNLGNYTNPFTVSSATNGGTIGGANSQCASCGDPGQALSTLVTLTAADSTSSLDIGLLNTTFTYDPSTQGSIISIGASVSNFTSELTFTSNGSTLASASNQFNPLIQQDGNYFVATIAGGPSDGFVLLSNTLLATNFDQINTTTGALDTSSHPNFSGDVITLGLAVEAGSIFIPGFTQTIVNDNLNFDIQSQVPEPTTFLLIGAALVGLAIKRKRIER